MNEKLRRIAQEICELEKTMREQPDRQASLQKTMDKIVGKLSMEEMLLIDDYILSECNI